jgi:cytochrome c-type biogenesis protein CcmF
MKSENNTFFSSVKHIFKINVRRYAGYLIHFGVILIYLAIVGTSVYKQEKEITLQQGAETTIGDYRLVYSKMGDKRDANKDVLTAELDVFKGSEKLGTLTPRRNFYTSTMGKTQYTTEVAVRSTLKEDLYVILASYQDDGSATFTFLVNPLQIWMWIGGVLITIGVIIILVHSARNKKTQPDLSAKISKKEKDNRS